MLVGVTGTIGAGKSTFARALEALGARRVDADAVAHQVLTFPAVIERVRQAFGPGVLAGDGSIDRGVLGRVVFADENARRRLEEIVKPSIASQIRHNTATRENEVVVLDAPLIYEWGLEGDCDAVVVVDAPEETRIERLAQRAGWSAEEVRRRQAAQLPASDKRRRATWVVENAADNEALWQEAQIIWGRLGKRTKK